MKTFWKVLDFIFWRFLFLVLCLFFALGIVGLVRGQEKPKEKPATVAISAESQQALLQLQREFEIEQAKLDEAKAIEEAAHTRVLLHQEKLAGKQEQYRAIHVRLVKDAPEGYVLDEGKMQYVVKEAEKKEPK